MKDRLQDSIENQEEVLGNISECSAMEIGDWMLTYAPAPDFGSTTHEVTRIEDGCVWGIVIDSTDGVADYC